MRFTQLLAAVEDEPVFETGLLLAGSVDPADVRRQLSRWTQAGRLHQLRRGLYALAPPYRRVVPHPFLVANRLAPGSYVSLQSALAHHGLIPEHVAATTSVHAGRPMRCRTPLGAYEYRHLSARNLTGFLTVALGGQQDARVAGPEKALLDLVYLEPGADARPYLEELRLQRLDALDIGALRRQALAFGRPKLQRGALIVAGLAAAEREAYQLR